MKFAYLMLIGAIAAVKLDNPRDDSIIDALTPAYGSCEPKLWISKEELDW